MKATKMEKEKAKVRSPWGGRKNFATLLIRRPLITSKDSQEAFKEDDEKISVRRIQKILQKAGYKSRHTAQKPLLTERINLPPLT